MNPFRIVAKVVTVPAHVVKDGVRLVKIEQAGQDMLDLLDDAASHPELYRLPTWWERLLIAAQQVVSLIPLPETGRTTMKNWMQKVGMGLGVASVAAGTATMLITHPADCAAQLGQALCQVAVPLIAMVPTKVSAVIVAGGSVVAMLSGLFHAQPGAQAPAANLPAKV